MIPRYIEMILRYIDTSTDDVNGQRGTELERKH